MSCTHHVAGRCTNGLALPLFGETPSAGVCSVCPHSTAPAEGRTIVQAIAAKAKRTAAYVAAEASLALEGPVAPDVVERRLALCAACPSRLPSPEDEVGFCGACGCGERSRARLTVKATMPAATCPKNLW